MNFSRFASVKFHFIAIGVLVNIHLRNLTLVNLFSNYLNVLSMSQENGNIQILRIRTVSSEPSVFAEREKIENP